ncbi:MAG TPA: WhiB family transcriptional regulator [Mycobacteriales bacterium]
MTSAGHAWVDDGNASDASAAWDLLERPEWHRRAACRGMGPSAFYPESGWGHAPTAEAAAARAVCAECPVRAECADAGMGEHYGVWGGLSLNQRRAMRRLR